MTTPSSDDDNEMVECQECGHVMPVHNLALHSARCRHETSRSSIENTSNGDGDNTGISSSHDDSQTQEDEAAAAAEWPCPICTLLNPNSSDTCDVCNSPRDASSIGSEREPSPNVHNDLQSSNESSMYPGRRDVFWSSAILPQQQQQQEEPSESSASQEEAASLTTATPQWSCPRCTLFNSSHSYACEACAYSRLTTNNNNNNNPRDALQVEYREYDPRVTQAVGTTASIASWSLLGAVIAGPVGALVTGGAAAVLDGVQRHVRHRQLEQQLQQHGNRPRISMAQWGNTMMMSITSHDPTTGESRTRVVTIRPTANNRNASTLLNQMTDGDRQLFMDMLLRHAMANEGAAAAIDIPRGASPESIDKLPLTTLTQEIIQTELKENQKTCNVCLEEFQEQDEMRTLGCCHVFHRSCVDRWLSQVASCPICKKEIIPSETAAPVASAPAEQEQPPAPHNHGS